MCVKVNLDYTRALQFQRDPSVLDYTKNPLRLMVFQYIP